MHYIRQRGKNGDKTKKNKRTNKMTCIYFWKKMKNK